MRCQQCKSKDEAHIYLVVDNPLSLFPKALHLLGDPCGSLADVAKLLLSTYFSPAFYILLRSFNSTNKALGLLDLPGTLPAGIGQCYCCLTTTVTDSVGSGKTKASQMLVVPQAAVMLLHLWFTALWTDLRLCAHLWNSLAIHSASSSRWSQCVLLRLGSGHAGTARAECLKRLIFSASTTSACCSSGGRFNTAL